MFRPAIQLEFYINRETSPNLWGFSSMLEPFGGRSLRSSLLRDSGSLRLSFSSQPDCYELPRALPIHFSGPGLVWMREREFPTRYHDRCLTHAPWSPIWIAGHCVYGACDRRNVRCALDPWTPQVARDSWRSGDYGDVLAAPAGSMVVPAIFFSLDQNRFHAYIR